MPPATSRKPRPAGSPVQRIHEHAADAAQLLKVMGNRQRLLILCELRDGPLPVGELNRRVELSQSALSQHLALLRASGLVETQREAQSIRYSLPPGPVTRVIELLQDIYCPAPTHRPRSGLRPSPPARRRAGR